MAKVAFLGLGVMGFPMARHLAAKGHAVTVYNRTAAKAQAWASEHGGTAAATPAEAARDQEIVFCCVGNDDDLRQVTTGPGGAFAAMGRGTVFVDHTTASAEVARELEAAAIQGGFGFIDAPVSGGQAGAENGVLTVMCGGDGAVYARVEPIIMSYARSCRLIGSSGGRPAHQDDEPDLHRGTGAGPRGGDPFRPARRTRHRGRARRHLQGCRRLLADGEPRQDDEPGQVRFRLRGRLDAQGPVDLPRRGPPQRLPAPGHRARRPVLRGGPEDGRASAGDTSSLLARLTP